MIELLEDGDLDSRSSIILGILALIFFTGYAHAQFIGATLELGANPQMATLHPGDSANELSYTLTLMSVSPFGTPLAEFALAENGSVVDEFNISAGQSYSYSDLTVHAINVFNGIGQSSYATVGLYSPTVILSNGNEIVFPGHADWTAADAGAYGGPIWTPFLNFTTVNIGQQPVPALSSIAVEEQHSNRLAPSAPISALNLPQWMNLVFNGLSYTGQDTLRTFAVGNERFNINGYPGDTGPISKAQPYGYQTNINGGNGYNYVEVQSGDSSAFQVNGLTVSSLFINKDLGSVLYKDSNDANYTYVPGASFVNGAETYIIQYNLTYQYPASPMTGNIQTFTSRKANATTGQTSLYVFEPVVQNDSAGAVGRGYYTIDLYYNTTDASYGTELFNSNDPFLAEPYNAYAPGLAADVDFANGTEQQGFISPGGSELASISTSEVDLLYPRQLPLADWNFAPTALGEMGQPWAPSGSITVGTQPYDFLEAKQSVANNVRGDIDGAENNPIGNGFTTGGYMISGDANPTLAFKGTILGTVIEDERYFLVGESYYYPSGNGSYVADRAQIAASNTFTTPLPYYLGNSLTYNPNSLSTGIYYGANGQPIPANSSLFIVNSNVSVELLSKFYTVIGFPSMCSGCSSNSSGLPDLTSRITPRSQSMYVGQTVPIRITTSNIGNATANNSVTTLFISNATGGVVGSTTQYYYLPPLAPGASITNNTFNGTFTCYFPGNFTLVSDANYNFQVMESNYSNNKDTIVLTCTKPVTHSVCEDYECVQVSGAGNNTCTTNAQCQMNGTLGVGSGGVGAGLGGSTAPQVQEQGFLSDPTSQFGIVVVGLVVLVGLGWYYTQRNKGSLKEMK